MTGDEQVASYYKEAARIECKLASLHGGLFRRDHDDVGTGFKANRLTQIPQMALWEMVWAPFATSPPPAERLPGAGGLAPSYGPVCLAALGLLFRCHALDTLDQAAHSDCLPFAVVGCSHARGIEPISHLPKR